jgi:transcriptional/translational regulatory protein YebC/TACO1
MMDIEGVKDIQEDELENEETGVKYKALEILTERVQLAQIHKQIEEKGYIVESAEIIKVAKNKTDVDAEKSEKVDNLIELLEELDDVQAVWDGRKS